MSLPSLFLSTYKIINPLITSFVHKYTHTFLCSLIHSFIHSFTYPFISDLPPGCSESDYAVLDGADRAKDARTLSLKPCDYNLKPGWYRFKGGAGTGMANACVQQFYCGTIYTGWLRGPHPTKQQGVVTRQGCFNKHGNCCLIKVDVQVRNCGPFYLYKLPAAPTCQLRYCGNGQGEDLVKFLLKEWFEQMSGNFWGLPCGIISHSLLLTLERSPITLVTIKYMREISGFLKPSGQAVLPTQANSSQVTKLKLALAGTWLNGTVPSRASSQENPASIIWIRPRSLLQIAKQLGAESW